MGRGAVATLGGGGDEGDEGVRELGVDGEVEEVFSPPAPLLRCSLPPAPCSLLPACPLVGVAGAFATTVVEQVWEPPATLVGVVVGFFTYRLMVVCNQAVSN